MDDLLGWNSTRWGMTADEVIMALGAGSIQRSERVDFLNSYSELFIPGVQIGQLSFHVRFQMSKSKDTLEAVLLRHELLDTDAFPQAELEMVKSRVSEKFGRPMRIAAEDSFRWSFPSTTIDLSHIYIEGVVATLALMFREANTAPPDPIAAF